MSRLLAIAVALVLGVLTLGIVFLLGMRAKSPPVLSAVRRMNRRFVNPRQMRTAGTPGAYASIVQHTGRNSGKPYETPVETFRTDDGFVIVSPYGTQSDWLKNVLARGSATIVRDGQAYRVHRPELLPIEAADPFLPDGEKRNLRLFNVQQCLRLHLVTDEA